MTNHSELTIGVLAVQGAFIEHIKMLRQLGVNVVEVRKAEQLTGLDGWMIPGGESTTMGLIAERWGFGRAVARLGPRRPADRDLRGNDSAGRSGHQPETGRANPCWAALTLRSTAIILAAKSIALRLISSWPNWAMHRSMPSLSAWVIMAVGPQAQSLIDVTTPTGETVIAALCQGNLLATVFHPELTNDTRWHELFIRMVMSATDSQLHKELHKVIKHTAVHKILS